ncbi:heme-binding protein [Psychrobacillus sp. INOP01]|uniref:GlcG/HbpS family heme-binding protein n=1 Tax=Psychrobacillus sp. INOP01 TaxID=2829187 RepID=UPI001BA74772|nr:heme-binding protein [Psychrobacillus sp. INOP01]QUG41944.1 heme-binding protein [Psychrobacillus sp. INOP01]
MVVSLGMAKVLLEASEKKAREMGLSENIAIVDVGGNLKGFIRMDNAKFGGIEIAIDKAWTSVAMQMPTSNLANAAQPGGPSYGINTTNQGRIVVLGGGVPLVHNQKIVGGIGVSGATSAQDIEVANAAVSVFEAMVQRQH